MLQCYAEFMRLSRLKLHVKGNLPFHGCASLTSVQIFTQLGGCWLHAVGPDLHPLHVLPLGTLARMTAIGTPDAALAGGQTAVAGALLAAHQAAVPP